MKTLQEIKKTLVEHKEEIARKYHVKSIGVFGSYSRGDNLPSSDVDILVDFSQPIGLEFVDLAEELEGILEMKVDLVPREAIKSEMFAFVEGDLVYV
ncbi:MAG: nucleotidyltransferase family protein [Ignavibacteriae bacterium]|nr:nucleotidyltransferase family protein [Ignavibacteriota bacterium]